MVSVIVPHYSDLAGLDRCLGALSRQSYPRDRFEIIVGDNNSPEGVEAVTRAVAGRARVTVITEKGAGLAKNGALALATSGMLAFTDSDCVPEPEWLERGVGALAELDVVGGKMQVFPDDETNINAVECFELVFRFDNEAYVRQGGFTVTPTCSPGARCSTASARSPTASPRMWSDATGPPPPDIGWATGTTSSSATRHVRIGRRCAKCTRRQDREMFMLRVTSSAARVKWLMRSLAYPLSAVAHTPKVLVSRRLTGPRQRLGALIVLYRLRLFRTVIGFTLLLSGNPGRIP
jgi:glycosyltransferase involved in cell wall biosynthesis